MCISFDSEATNLPTFEIYNPGYFNQPSYTDDRVRICQNVDYPTIDPEIGNPGYKILNGKIVFRQGVTTKAGTAGIIKLPELAPGTYAVMFTLVEGLLVTEKIIVR